ncbi:allergen rasp f9-like protein [Plectosphaerella plurivora]|uniref:Crh-like protein n=1 Tax=Plectosphaerella plurivora TaxID=936078 RepID=A0A9P8VGA5_9PEZI|nr:allergen rasp f9-like protein [Plectosphaerella plurivora]
MFNKSLILALAASTLVTAQTHTDCDPRKKKCPDAPALGKTVNIDFTKSKGEEYLHTLPGTTVEYDGEKGAIFSIANEKQAPTKASDDYIFFGELNCEVQAAAGPGIVTSIVLQSDDLDEIDWEWVGGDNKQVQSNYFSKGDTTTYDRGAYHDVANPVGQFHKYGIVWTQEKIDWTIDGAVVRTLTYAAAGNGAKFPQSPMQIKMGTWTAGRSDAPEGTVTWAGGKADFSNGPAIGYYKNCQIVDYMGGKTGATSYSYPDGYDGRYQSIIVKTDGSKSDEDDSTTTSKAPASTKTSAAASSTEKAESTTVATVTKTTDAAESTSTDAESDDSETTSAAVRPTSSSANSDSEEAAATSSGAAAAASEEPASGMSVKTNMVIGAAGLVAALFFN